MGGPGAGLEGRLAELGLSPDADSTGAFRQDRPHPLPLVTAFASYTPVQSCIAWGRLKGGTPAVLPVGPAAPAGAPRLMQALRG